MTAMSEARMEEGAKRKGRRWSLDTITPKFNLWKRSSSVVDGPLSHRNSIATQGTISEEGATPPRGGAKKATPTEVYAVLDLEGGGHIVLTGRDETQLKSLYVDVGMEYRVSSYRVIVASTKSVLKLDNGSPTVTKSFENVYEKFETVDPTSKSDDPRFGLVEDLLQSEREYCSQLRSIFDCYAEPLRKYSSLSKEDHRMLFLAVEPILSISAMLTSKLESVIQSWNTQTSKIGNLFPSKFWNQYSEYYDSYDSAQSFLKEKCKSDSTFAEFCNLRREQGKLGIDTLLHLPIKRIPEYDKYLKDLLDETRPNHPDFDDLRKVAAKVNSMVREREEEVREADNDNKVENVQDRFPHDDLNLRDKSQKVRGLAARRKSAPSAVLFKSLGSGKSKSSSSLWAQNTMGKKEGDGTTRTDANRIYIMEGPVQLAAGMQTQDRYLFLFSDLLLVAKQKSSTTFKLKSRIQLCDIWLANCIDEVTEITLPEDKSFVIGWPTTNMVATFKDADTKEKWLTKLTAQVQEEKSKEESRTTQLKVVNKRIDQECTVLVHNTCEAKDVHKMCMARMLIPETEQKEYCLWVLSGKDAVYPLIGHEYPYAIKLSHVREQLKPKGDVDSEVLSNMDSIMEESTNPKVEFILNHKKSPKKHSIEDTSNKTLKKAKKSNILKLFKRNNDNKPGYPGTNSGNKPGKLFERPLEEVCDENCDPSKPIMELLTILFREGPFTSGILRKSANARQIRELRQKLDNEEEVNFDDYSRCLLGSLLKDYFRTLPRCLLGEQLFDQWVKTVSIENFEERLETVIGLIDQLPEPNKRLLRLLMSVLYQIDRHQDVNMMGANNISVCIAPSLLWQKTEESNLVNNSVTSVVSVIEFMINNACSLLGDDIPHLLGEVNNKMRQDSGTDSDSLNNGLRRDDSSIDSLVDRDLYTGEADSSPKMAKSHLSPSNLSHDSGLSHSDTQLNEEEDYETNERKVYRNGTSYIEEDSDLYTQSLDGRYNLDPQDPVPPPRYRKKRDYTHSSSLDVYPSYNSRYGVSGRQCRSLDPEELRLMNLSKRISTDSLHSVEESTEGESEHDFPSQRQAESLLIKSASGAHLYFENQCLPRISSMDSQMGRQGRDRLVRQSSVTDSTPPLSPHSKFSYGSSYDSVLSDSSYMQDFSRGNSINSAPQTPDEFPEGGLPWGTEERERSNSNPTRLHSNVHTSTEKASPSKLSADYSGLSLKSMQNMRYLVSPPVSPIPDRRVKSEGKDPSVRHSMPPVYKTTVEKEVPAASSPQISITYCSSGSDERLDDNTNQVKQVGESSPHPGAPVKQISLYTQGLSSQARVGIQNIRMSPRKDTSPVKASHDSAILSQVRRNSLENSSKSDDDCESRTSSLSDKSSRAKFFKSFEPDSSSDNSSVDERPHQPPSYNEAVYRTNLLKQGIPLEISEQDTQRQKEASARARKLYESSLKQFEGTKGSPEKSFGVAMQQTSHLKQHIEQTSNPATKTYQTRMEESSSVVQVINPEEEKEDVYVRLHQHRKDPRKIFDESIRMYEQQAREAKKTEVKSQRHSYVTSPRKDNIGSAYSKPDSYTRVSFDKDSRAYSTINVSRDPQNSGNVRANQESSSYVKVDANEKNVKTTLNVPSSSIHRSLSDSADRLNKFSKYSPRLAKREIEITKNTDKSERRRSDVSSNPVHTVHKTSTTTTSSSSSSRDLPWSVSKLKNMFDADQTATSSSSSSSSSSSTTTTSFFYNPESKVSTVTLSSTSRPAPPPYKSPPPFRRNVDNWRLSTSSSSSNTSSTNQTSSKHSTFSAHKFGPQSLDYNSFSSSSEDLESCSRYSYRRRDSSSGVSDQEMDSYTDISYV